MKRIHEPERSTCACAPGRAGFSIAMTLAALGALTLTLGPNGCAHNPPAADGPREVRLTHDQQVKVYPRFSPDGRLVAYATAVPGEKKGSLGLFVIPREGGEPKRISPDSIAVFPIQWTADGRRIIAADRSGHILYTVGLDGSVDVLDPGEALTMIVDVSPDARRELTLRFNKDNRDVGIQDIGGKFEYLMKTPDWEEDACFGPGAGQVTVVSRPSYQAPVSSISIWSPETGKATPLPLPEGQNVQPAWSPDARLMAYTVVRNGEADIWLYDSRGATADPLTHDPDDSTSPAWSPDGAWLAFTRSAHTSHLFAGDPRGSDRRQLTKGEARDFAPVVSPDGRWIAFLRRLPAGAGAPSSGPVLCVMPTAGGDVKQLDLGDLTIPTKGMYIMNWSKDGRYLAFNASKGSSKLDIYRIARDGTDLARVTIQPGDEVEPHWSPDGRWIAYTQAGGGMLEMSVVPSNGGNPRLITQPGQMSEDAVWSPESDRIAYVTYRDDGNFEIWIAPLDAPAKRTRVLTDKEVAWPFAWTPDGRELLLARGKGADWRVSAFSLADKSEVTIGKEVELPSGRGSSLELNAKGEPYEKLIFPGGKIMADGEATADIYMIHVRDIATPSVVASREEASR